MDIINIDDQHKLLLDIAQAFDNICSSNDIPYYMLGGSMLGAIRHKGFIPWDDDMDFGVQLEYFPKLIKCLDEQLPEYLKCCTYNNNQSVFYPFVKISDTRTIIDDLQIPLPLEEKIGINVDVFPLVQCRKEDQRIKTVWKIVDFYGKIYTNSRSRTGGVLLIKKALRFLCPISKKSFCNIIWKKICEVEEKDGDFLGNIIGRWKEKELIPISWYGRGVKYDFDKITLFGIKEYDKYLTHLYGNYMLLPPLEDRISNHVKNVYWKENIQ